MGVPAAPRAGSYAGGGWFAPGRLEASRPPPTHGRAPLKESKMAGVRWGGEEKEGGGGPHPGEKCPQGPAQAPVDGAAPGPAAQGGAGLGGPPRPKYLKLAASVKLRPAPLLR